MRSRPSVFLRSWKRGQTSLLGGAPGDANQPDERAHQQLGQRLLANYATTPDQKASRATTGNPPTTIYRRKTDEPSRPTMHPMPWWSSTDGKKPCRTAAARGGRWLAT